MIVDLPELNLRPGEYPLYLHVSESTESPSNYDVLDDLTPPLVIVAGPKARSENFDPSRPIGIYSIDSRMTVLRIDTHHPADDRQLALTNQK